MTAKVPRNFGARAEEIRTIAEAMRDEGSRKLLLQLADGYDKMDAEHRARREPSPNDGERQ